MPRNRIFYKRNVPLGGIPGSGSKVVALGSQNWSGDGVERNRDASLIIEHQGAAQYFEKIFLHDWETLAKQKLTHEKSIGDYDGGGTKATKAEGAVGRQFKPSKGSRHRRLKR